MKLMYVDLTGLTALVTGGGTGIGKAISLGLARCGCRVVVNYSVSRNAAEDTINEIEQIGGKAVAIQADITCEEQVRMLVEKTYNKFGGLDILIANAGGPTEFCPTEKLSSERWDNGLGLNCKSAFYCVKHAIPRMPENSGRIIITSSISARSGGGPGMITYAAAMRL